MFNNKANCQEYTPLCTHSHMYMLFRWYVSIESWVLRRFSYIWLILCVWAIIYEYDSICGNLIQRLCEFFVSIVDAAACIAFFLLYVSILYDCECVAWIWCVTFKKRRQNNKYVLSRRTVRQRQFRWCKWAETPRYFGKIKRIQ